MIARTLMFFAMVLVSAPSAACTLCHSRVAEEVRARLFDTDFSANLLMVTAPALILFAAIFYTARTPWTDTRPM